VESILKNGTEQYSIKGEVREESEKNIENCIAEGWLKEYHGDLDGILSLTVDQRKGETSV
jgi:hypothetical protein